MNEIHNPHNVDNPVVIAAEIKKMFGRDLSMVSKNELAASVLKMRAMLSYLHVELYCENPKHSYFQEVRKSLNNAGIVEMEKVRRLRMNKIRRWLANIRKGGL
jgi:hypothetical protein